MRNGGAGNIIAGSHDGSWMSQRGLVVNVYSFPANSVRGPNTGLRASQSSELFQRIVPKANRGMCNVKVSVWVDSSSSSMIVLTSVALPPAIGSPIPHSIPICPVPSLLDDCAISNITSSKSSTSKSNPWVGGIGVLELIGVYFSRGRQS